MLSIVRFAMSNTVLPRCRPRSPRLCRKLKCGPQCRNGFTLHRMRRTHGCLRFRAARLSFPDLALIPCFVTR